MKKAKYLKSKKSKDMLTNAMNANEKKSLTLSLRQQYQNACFLKYKIALQFFHKIIKLTGKLT